jgi:hypothetical protein
VSLQGALADVWKPTEPYLTMNSWYKDNKEALEAYFFMEAAQISSWAVIVKVTT